MNTTLFNILEGIPLALRTDDNPFDANTFVVQNGKVPNDYLIAMSAFHGGAGSIGQNYIDLWEPEEIANLNLDYQVQEFAPGFTIFGSDGGDTAYAFERASGFIFEFPFIGMTIDESAILIDESFQGFLSQKI